MSKRTGGGTVGGISDSMTASVREKKRKKEWKKKMTAKDRMKLRVWRREWSVSALLCILLESRRQSPVLHSCPYHKLSSQSTSEHCVPSLNREHLHFRLREKINYVSVGNLYIHEKYGRKCDVGTLLLLGENPHNFQNSWKTTSFLNWHPRVLGYSMGFMNPRVMKLCLPHWETCQLSTLV